MTKKFNIPAVEKVLENHQIKELISLFGRETIKNLIRNHFTQLRLNKLDFDFNNLITFLNAELNNKYTSSLKRVINATGILLHTNLGRAPLGDFILNEIKRIAEGYSNLEFDLEKGKRGNRNSHIKNLMKTITNSEDAIVVNNNAAAVMLTLQTFAKGKEVIISRGELIEIGGSFRIPDIMKTSGAKMVEVGTTNRTKLSDYENAINENTAMILKAHKSNYYIEGFTEEVCIKDLSKLAKKHRLIMYYDLGSGLLKKPEKLNSINEPTVKNAIDSGADIVSFSGDKLFGGPQAGIIVGKSMYIKKIEKNPLMRALRVGKLTLAGLSAIAKSYLNEENLLKNIPIFKMLARKKEELLILAKHLQTKLKKYDIDSEILSTSARAGGGTLPNLTIESYGVKPTIAYHLKASRIYLKLLKSNIPVISVLKQGDIIFDVFTLQENDLDIIVENLNIILKGQ